MHLCYDDYRPFMLTKRWSLWFYNEVLNINSNYLKNNNVNLIATKSGFSIYFKSGNVEWKNNISVTSKLGYLTMVYNFKCKNVYDISCNNYPYQYESEQKGKKKVFVVLKQ